MVAQVKYIDRGVAPCLPPMPPLSTYMLILEGSKKRHFGPTFSQLNVITFRGQKWPNIFLFSQLESFEGLGRCNSDVLTRNSIVLKRNPTF